MTSAAMPATVPYTARVCRSLSRSPRRKSVGVASAHTLHEHSCQTIIRMNECPWSSIER